MKKRNRILAALLCLTMAGSLMACGSSADQAQTSSGTETGAGTGTEEDKTSLSVAVHQDPLSMAPNAYSSNGFIIAQIYDQLWYLIDGERIMRAAESVETNDDLHFTIKMKEGIVDTAGNEIKASDVLFSISLAKNGTSGYPGATRFVDVENSEVIDDYTLKVAMTQPCSFQIDSLSLVNLVSEASYNSSPDQMVEVPIGSGPYKLSEYVTGSYAKLEANEDYWDGAPEIKNITVTIIQEGSQRTNALLTGEADLVNFLPAIDAETVQNTNGLEFWAEDSINTATIMFNCSSVSPCANVDLRQAIAYALNNAALMQAACQGYATPVTTSTTSQFADYDPDWETITEGNGYYAYNLEMAKECLARSGVPEGTTLKLIHGSTTEEIPNVEIIQANLAEIGLNVEIFPYPNVKMQVITDQPEDWDIAWNSWTNYPAQSTLATFNTFLGTNQVHMEGEEEEQVLGLISEAMSCYDDAERKDIMMELETVLFNNIPIYGLYSPQRLWGYKEGLNLKWKCQDFPIFAEMSWK